MATSFSKQQCGKHDDVFSESDVENDTFSIENRTWKRLEEQRHKV